MKITDLVWRQIFNNWSEADLLYLRSIIDEKLACRPKRRALIRGEGP